MVNIGIDRLQQLVQQPPSDYASTNCDDKSAMAATSNRKKFGGNVLLNKRAQGGQEGTPASAPQSNAIDITDSVSAKILQKILYKKKRQQETR